MKNIFSLSIFAFGSVLIFTQYSWNPDPHHDGIMFTAAIGFTDGLIPNIDYFAQYGPLASVIQGSSMQIFGPNLLGLRFFTASLLILTGALFSYRAFNAYGKKAACLLWICWSLTGPMGLPWATVITTCIIVLVLFFSFGHQKQTYYFRPNFFLVASQFLIIGSLIRIHLAVIVILIAGLLIVKNSLFTRKFAIKWLIFSVLNISLCITVLIHFNILDSYFEQSFKWAIDHYGTPAITFTYLSGLIWFVLVPGVIYALSWLINKCILNRTNLRYLFLLFIFLFLILALKYSSGYVNRKSETLFDPKYFLIEFSRRVLLMLNYLPVTLFLICVALLLLNRKRLLLATRENLIIIVIGLGTISQLYPLFDPWHLWMVSPVFFMCLLVLQVKLPSISSYSSALISITVIITIVLSLQFLKNFNSQSYEFQSTVLKGMSSSRQDALQLDTTMLALENATITKRGVQFLCTDGLYASATQHYLSDRPMFVDWGIDSKSMINDSHVIFICDYTQSAVDRYMSEDWKVIFLEPSGHTNYRSEPLFNALIRRD